MLLYGLILPVGTFLLMRSHMVYQGPEIGSDGIVDLAPDGGAAGGGPQVLFKAGVRVGIVVWG